VDSQALRASAFEVVDEGGLWRAVVGRVGGVCEVELDDGDIPRGDEPDERGANGEADRFAFVRGPVSEGGPARVAVADVDFRSE
jgi:hypothetical protein